MTTSDELAKRRAAEALSIRTSLNRQRGEQRANTKGGEGTVAYVTAEKCIGCDQCTIVCDDDAIAVYLIIIIVMNLTLCPLPMFITSCVAHGNLC